jgi:hypothetical protein
MTSPLPAYAVPGVKPVGGTDDLRSVQYSADQLAAFPPVAAALDRTPEVLLAIRFDGEERSRSPRPAPTSARNSGSAPATA